MTRPEPATTTAIEAEVSKRIREMADSGTTWKTNSFETVNGFYRRLRAKIRDEMRHDHI